MTEPIEIPRCSCCNEVCEDKPIVVEWQGNKLTFCDLLCAAETAEQLNAYFDDEQCKFLPNIEEAGTIPLRNIHNLNAVADDVRKWLGERDADFAFILACKVEGKDWRAEY